MTQRYLGGIITANPVEPSSNLSNASASGMWTLQEALSFYRAGDWPDPTNTPSVGLFMAGYSGASAVNVVDKVVPEQAGNATDFGDTSATKYQVAGFSSDTRSIVAGGYLDTNVLEYFTFSSAGDATDFGDLSAASYGGAGFSNNVRGIIALGYTSPANVNTIEYVTIPTTGNATDFGNLTVARSSIAGG